MDTVIKTSAKGIIQYEKYVQLIHGRQLPKFRERNT